MKKAVLVLLFVLALPPGAPTADGQQGSDQASEQTGLIDMVAPFKSYGHVYDANSFESMRPRIMGTRGAVATGHYLPTIAALEVLKKGGNAFDAGVTAAMALKVLKMGFAGWTGVAPLILYSAQDGEVVTRVGAGTTPAKATLEYFLEHGKTPINTALLPADVDVWLAALDRFGTLSFAEAAQPALEVAESGYHLYKHQKGLLDRQQDNILKFPYNTQFWFQHGVGKQQLGDLMVNEDLGRLIRYMIDAEKRALSTGVGRSDAIQAARDTFYKGEPARAVGRFFAEHDGIVTYEDMASYEGAWMAPLHTTFMGYDVFVCDGWSQGPRLILFLNILENFDLKSLGYNTPEYIHLISQAVNLGMSDSHKYIGDPDVVDIPPRLYSKEYARHRADLIDMNTAFADMPPWGDPDRLLATAAGAPRRFAGGTADDGGENEAARIDTTSLNVIDGEGNVFSMTQSDGHTGSPMIPGWGFGLGGRMGQLNLDPSLANVMAPHKRPRNTNTPVLILKDGEPFMGLSTPGGDQQAQSILQVMLNVILWGMSPEQAVDQPRFGSYNFPGTGSEINQYPARLNLEDRIPAHTADALRRLGHDVQSWGLWNWMACALTVTYRDPQTGILIAAGDVRRETSALGY